VDSLVHDLRAIGVDLLPGFFPPSVMGSHLVRLDSIEATELAAQLSDVHLLDVRGASEWAEGYIPGAHHLPLPELPARWQELPRDRRIVTQCSSGVRSQVAASFLQRQGFEQVATFDGGMDALKAAGLPVEQRNTTATA
jgi:hydroxyacylglutathione hydrolase